MSLSNFPVDPVHFTNRMAAFVWGFTLCWFGMLVLFSYIMLRDGPHSEWQVLVLAAFWIGGLVLVIQSMSSPVVRTTATPTELSVKWIYPHKITRHVYAAKDCSHARVVERKDSEGDPYFFARVPVQSQSSVGEMLAFILNEYGMAVNLGEGHSKEHCQSLCDDFNKVLDKRPPLM